MRNTLATDRLDTNAAQAIANFHPNIVKEVKEAVEGNKIVVVGMRQNPVVKKARNALGQAGLEFKYLEYGSYFEMWKPRLAIKLWSGWPTFPQVFIGGKLIGGHTELALWLKQNHTN